MEKGKHAIDVVKKTVTFGHETKTGDGSVIITTTFDFSNVDMARLLKRAGDAELIAWRAKSGIKEMTTAQAQALDNTIVDCSKITERVKKVETPEELALKEVVKGLLAQGKSVADILSALAK